MKKCVNCDKMKVSGNNVSHSHRRTKRIFKPNLQKATVDGKKVLLCAKCLKTQNKV